MAQMNPYNIPMKNLTLICGNESMASKFFKHLMWTLPVICKLENRHDFLRAGPKGLLERLYGALFSKVL